MKNLNTIRNTPRNQLSALDFWKLRVNSLMVELRNEINSAKVKGYCYQSIEYRIGRLHGVLFYTDAILWNNYWNYQELEDIRAGVMNEVSFLTGPYIEGVRT